MRQHTPVQDRISWTAGGGIRPKDKAAKSGQKSFLAADFEPKMLFFVWPKAFWTAYYAPTRDLNPKEGHNPFKIPESSREQGWLEA